MTCLYGYPPKQSFSSIPFINTPAGIKAYPKNDKHLNEAKDRCHKIVDLFNYKLYGEQENAQMSVVPMDTYFIHNNLTIYHSLLFNIYYKSKQQLDRAWQNLQIHLKPITNMYDNHHYTHAFNDTKFKATFKESLDHTEYEGVFFYKPTGYWYMFTGGNNTKIRRDSFLLRMNKDIDGYVSFKL